MTLSFRDVIKPEGSTTPRDMCVPRLGVERKWGCGHPRGWHVAQADGLFVCRHPVHGDWFEDCGREIDCFPWLAVMKIRATVAGQAKMAKALKQLLEGALR